MMKEFLSLKIRIFNDENESLMMKIDLSLKISIFDDEKISIVKDSNL
jgi:hypothetical protein